MKNKQKFLLLIGLFSAFSILFSCGNKDDESPQQDKIIGTWTFGSMDYDATVNGQDFIAFLVETYGISESEAQAIVDTYFIQEIEDDFQGTITFKTDGTYEVKDGSSTETGTYSLQNNDTKLIMNPDDEDDDSIEFDVTEFTNNKLSLNYSDEYEEDITEDGVDETIEISIQVSLMK